MNRELNVFTLRMLRDQYHAEHLDTEAEALEAAISALEQPELIEQGAYVRGFEQGRTQGMLDAKLQPTCNKLATDCISRQAAIAEIDEWIKAFRENGHKESAADARLIQDGIIQLPSVQPEIIRCKDCKNRKTTIIDVFPELKAYGCDHIISYMGDNDFCSRAERRTDG